MSIDNPLWGAPRIHGELLKLGFEVAQSTVAKYMVKRWGPPSQGWRTFLQNHAPDIAAMDLFVVPTINFSLLYAFVIVRLDRRELVWINVTQNPTAEWIARQLTEAFPWEEAPRYLIRDNDRVYGDVAQRRIRAMGIRDKPIAPASPWQNGFAERLIGSIRRECLDHLVVLGEAQLRRILQITPTTTTRSGRTGRWAKIRPASVRFTVSGTLRHTLFSAGFITIMFGFRFSVHTRVIGATARSRAAGACAAVWHRKEMQQCPAAAARSGSQGMGPCQAGGLPRRESPFGRARRGRRLMRGQRLAKLSASPRLILRSRAQRGVSK